MLLEPGGAPLRGAFSAEAAPAWFAVMRGMLWRSSRITLEQLAPRTVLPTQIQKKITLKYFKCPYIGLKSAKTFFKSLPKFASIGEKSTKLATLSAKNRFFSHCQL
jgi:hypothetical protein